MTLVEHLRALEVDEVGVYLLQGQERDEVVAACRDAGKSVVDLDLQPAVVITADAMLQDGVVHTLKEDVDAAVPDAQTVIVLRLVGDAPLAPTMDAYLDVEMIAGRDVWLDDL